MRYILLDKDNKIIDKCSELKYRIPNPEIPDSDYFTTNKKDIMAWDTWDHNINDSLKDSPTRDPNYFDDLIKNPEIELLKERITILEQKLELLKNP